MHHFRFVLLCIWGQFFKYNAAPGGLSWRGDLTEGFLCYWFGGLIYNLEGLIHGGAYFWNFMVSLYPCFDVIIVVILFNFQVNRVPWKILMKKLLLCNYCSQGHLGKVDPLDYRKVTIHFKKVGCGPIFDSKPFTLLNVAKNVNVLMKVILCCVIVFHGWFIFVVLPYYLGCDPFNQNVWKFRFNTQWVSLVQLEKFRKNWSTFWGGPLFPVRLVGILVKWITPLESPLAPAGQD